VEVAQRFDEALRDRVTLLLLAAAEAIVKLGEVDFVRYEADEEQGGHTLALWEEMAPVTGSTVQHVNEVVAGATAQFPLLPKPAPRTTSMQRSAPRQALRRPRRSRAAPRKRSRAWSRPYAPACAGTSPGWATACGTRR